MARLQTEPVWDYENWDPLYSPTPRRKHNTGSWVGETHRQKAKDNIHQKLERFAQRTRGARVVEGGWGQSKDKWLLRQRGKGEGRSQEEGTRKRKRERVRRKGREGRGREEGRKSRRSNGGGDRGRGVRWRTGRRGKAEEENKKQTDSWVPWNGC